jgi:hypothetical protein
MTGSTFVVTRCFAVGFLFLVACAASTNRNSAGTPLVYADPSALAFVLNADSLLQTVDGFGVNVTPAQWRDGHLRSTLDTLVDELGSTIIRLDCVGLANWLDPAQRNAAGKFEDAYLSKIYSSKVFRDCWETYRYLQSKTGVEVYLSVSGRVPALMAGSDGKTLVDVQAYAQMLVSMAAWARTHEHLNFRSIDPLNETDLGYPEGPKILDSDLVKVLKAVVAELDAAGLQDVTLIGPSDTHVALKRFDLLLSSPDLASRFRAFSSHTYGNGHDQEEGAWYTRPTPAAELVVKTKSSPFRHVGIWMNEYGDLDESGRIEFEVAWRSTRRLLKALSVGFTGAMAWDAFDNLHEHDSAWSTFGLLATDTNSWTYTRKPRFYAAKQVYKYVRPGFTHVGITPPQRRADDVFAEWHDASRNVTMEAFVAPDRQGVTVVGQNQLDGETLIQLDVRSLPKSLHNAKMTLLLTTYDKAHVATTVQAKDGVVSVVLPYRSIFTLTTLSTN